MEDDLQDEEQVEYEDDDEENQDDDYQYDDDEEHEEDVDDDRDNVDTSDLDDDLFDDDMDDEESDGDNPHQASDELDEEDPTDEEIEDEEEASELEDFLAQDPNAEPLDDEEEDDEEYEFNERTLNDLAWQDPKWSEVLGNAEDNGINIREDYVALMARGRIDPQFIAERDLYSIKDIHSYILSLEDKTDPKAITVPFDDDYDGWVDFEENVLNVPRTAEEFDNDMFDHTYMKDDQTWVDNAKDFYHSIRLGHEQAKAITSWVNDEREAFLKQAEQDELDYRRENKTRLQETFGKQYKGVLGHVRTFLQKYGPEFLDEFKGSKALNSETLTMMIYNAMNDIESNTGVDMKGYNMRLAEISDQRLDNLWDKLLNHKYSDNEYQSHKNPDIALKARKVALKLRAVEQERSRRGMDDEETK